MKERIKTEEMELTSRFDSAKSFYGKAVEAYFSDGTIELRSYGTLVATIHSPDIAEVYGWFSNTTGRHIKEFLKQHGFKAVNKSQILKDYYKEDTEGEEVHRGQNEPIPAAEVL